VHTVERHVVNVLRKLDLTNRGEINAWAHRHGLVD
jgi:DNA-binding NarL/FixJ family response regulator